MRAYRKPGRLAGLAAILSIVSLAAPSAGFAQDDPPHLSANSDDVLASLMVCSYNDAGEFTGADSARPGEMSGDPVKTGQGGDQAWRWVVVGKDAAACPRHIPA